MSEDNDRRFWVWYIVGAIFTAIVLKVIGR